MSLDLFFQQFDKLADAPNSVPKLRELIRQLAVQGKLVEQNPNDEPAGRLLSRIKKRNNRAKITDVPPALKSLKNEYSIPYTWEWASLNDICTFINGDRGKNYPSKDKRVDSGVPFINAGHLNSGRVSLSNMNYITEERFELLNSGKVTSGDILFCLRGSLGKVALVDNIEKGAIASSLVIIRKDEEINANYLLTYFSSTLAFLMIDIFNNGTAQPNLSASDLRKFILPIPPLEEQKRIVSKIEQLMQLCEQLEAQQQKRHNLKVSLNNGSLKKLLTATGQQAFEQRWNHITTHFDGLYDTNDTVERLRSSILLLAVQGRLTQQNPNDEPALAVVQRIKEEKKNLFQQGKIKKLPDLKPISNVPYELPTGWTWARFPELGEFGRGKSKHRPRNDNILYQDGTYPVVQTGDVARANGKITTYTGLYNEVGLAQSKLWSKGTMCITIAANIADSGILTFDACFPDSVVGFIPSQELGDPRYFEYFMRTAKDHLVDFAPSTAQKNINLGILETVLIPLPPVSEMKRIVEKLDHYMLLCDQIQERIKLNNEQAKALLSSLVHALCNSTIDSSDISSVLAKQAASIAFIVDWFKDEHERCLRAGKTRVHKTQHLLQEHLGLPLGLKPSKDAAGPHDPTIEAAQAYAEEHGWIEMDIQQESPRRTFYHYYTSHNTDEALSVFQDMLDSLDNEQAVVRLVQQLRPLSSKELEGVATVYSCWQESIVEQESITDDALIRRFFDWHERKRENFTEADVRVAINWIRIHNIIPHTARTYGRFSP